MSLDFTLEIDCDLTTEEAKTLLVEEIGFERNPFPSGAIVGAGVRCMLLEPSEETREIVSKVFAFTPDLRVFFTLDKFEKQGEGVKNMLRATFALLDRGRDAVLLFIAENVVLLRRDGRLLLGNDWWDDPESLSQVRVPYERRTFPDL